VGRVPLHGFNAARYAAGDCRASKDPAKRWRYTVKPRNVSIRDIHLSGAGICWAPASQFAMKKPVHR